ncbi:hypothetical protein LCGC14_0582280 [marine sediment metagenome]|uniref:Uncharacterized protein n=1 Tax=marine sediment metagenome TaxID=412755 RepID=A0A0F9UPB4_9ZZZZ
MSLTYTYTQLVAVIKSYAEDLDPNFVASVDDFIAKAELRVLRDLDLELFETWSNLTISSGNRTVPKPSNTAIINDVFVRSPSEQKWLELPRRSYEYCIMYAPIESDIGVPKFYAELDGTNIYVVPTPDQAYASGNSKARATIRPTGLSSDNATSWLGDNLADLLFHGCMIEVHNFLKHPAKVKEAADMYNSLINQISREQEQGKRPKYKALNAQKEQKGADD